VGGYRCSGKLEVANPGGFRIEIREVLSGGTSDLRNETLMKMFSMLNIGDRAGSGIPNIYAVWEQQGWREPVYEEKVYPDRTMLFLDLMRIGDKRKKSATKICDKIKKRR